jgi:hypothetical protein
MLDPLYFGQLFYFTISSVYTMYMYMLSKYMKLQKYDNSRDRMAVGFITTCAISAYHH